MCYFTFRLKITPSYVFERACHIIVWRRRGKLVLSIHCVDFGTKTRQQAPLPNLNHLTCYLLWTVSLNTSACVIAVILNFKW